MTDFIIEVPTITDDRFKIIEHIDSQPELVVSELLMNGHMFLIGDIKGHTIIKLVHNKKTVLGKPNTDKVTHLVVKLNNNTELGEWQGLCEFKYEIWNTDPKMIMRKTYYKKLIECVGNILG